MLNFNIKSKTNFQTKENGFTLVEMAISLVIVGLILSSGLYAYSIYLENKQSTKTLNSVSTVSMALFQFKNANGRYPCPAPLLEKREVSPTYGHETDCSDPQIGTGAIVSPGTCLDQASGNHGICVEASTRSIGGVHPRVRVGAIPFRNLQIDEKDTFDGYGSRLVYAMTEDMGVESTYKDSIAAIEIRDGAGNVLSGNEKSVAFLVLSPGKNKNGSVTAEGITYPCLTGTTNMDSQNCRDFTSTTNTNAIYVMDAQSSGTNQFDDIVEYFVPTGAEVWRREDQTSENIIDMSEDKVGVGILTPLQLTDDLTIRQSTVNNASLAAPSTGIADLVLASNLATTNSVGPQNQSGGLRVGKFSASGQQGKTLANRYCAEDGTSCFTTDVIAGAYDGNPVSGTSGMGCNTALGEYMIGIENGRAKCAPIRIACAPGLVMSGINATGSPKCETPIASCGNTPVSLCGTPDTLLAAGNGQERTINYTTGGACAYTKYKCNAGTWERQNAGSFDTAAACSYTSATAATGSTITACSTGYTGSYTQNYYLGCNGARVNTTNDSAAACTCVGTTENVSCATAFEIGVIGTRQKVCTGNVLGSSFTVFKDSLGISYPTEAALVAAKCSCTKSDRWEFDSCGTGKVRNPSPTPTSFISPEASWPSDTNMGKFRKRTINASTCKENTAPAYDSSQCVCATGYNWRDQNPTCAACYEVDTAGKVRQVRTSAASCGWQDDTDTSANTPGTCKPTTFVWKSSGVSAGKPNPLAEGHGTSPECGSGCSCGLAGLPSACALSNASQWSYFQATCSPR